MSRVFEDWKYPGLLLSAVGISYIGDFIYLVALNVFIFAKTDSVTAVAGLWLIAPIASIMTSSWSGSLIDRMNKKTIMIFTDILRGILVALIPLISDVWLIYAILFVISLCSSFFNPASGAYTVQLVPQDKLLRYNSISSILITGALVVGPAIAGAFVYYGSYQIAILCNAFSFFLSACFLSFLPSLHSKTTLPASTNKNSIATVISDWKMVFLFLKENRMFLSIYVLFQLIMTFAIALDSQEVVFTQSIIGLSESQYSLLLSITGLGYLAGSLFLTVFPSKIPIPYLIGFGSAIFSFGYLIYAFSQSFLSVSAGFIVLGFFSSFANTGFQTFYQKSIPADKMGRIGATLGFFQSVSLISTIVAAGILSEMAGVKLIVIGVSLLITMAAVILTVLTYFSHQSISIASKQKELAR
jgi:MFS family permease